MIRKAKVHRVKMGLVTTYSVLQREEKKIGAGRGKRERKRFVWLLLQPFNVDTSENRLDTPLLRS